MMSNRACLASSAGDRAAVRQGRGKVDTAVRQGGSKVKTAVRQGGGRSLIRWRQQRCDCCIRGPLHALERLADGKSGAVHAT